MNISDTVLRSETFETLKHERFQDQKRTTYVRNIFIWYDFKLLKILEHTGIVLFMLVELKSPSYREYRMNLWNILAVFGVFCQSGLSFKFYPRPHFNDIRYFDFVLHCDCIAPKLEQRHRDVCRSISALNIR